MLKILTFSTLYPNAEYPNHGIFVENRIRKLAESGLAEITVAAPVGYFPFTSKRFGQYASYARTPRKETRHGLDVYHPRYLVLPKIGMNVAPCLMYHSLRASMNELRARISEFDLIDAHYFYPDGVVAARFARDWDLPFTVTARGSDINEIANYAGPRKQILSAARQAAAIITVSQALKDRLIELGLDNNHIHVLRNGVDLELFQPKDRQSCRNELRVHGRLILSVGHLIPRKGHDLVIRALTLLPDMDLIIVGDGPERGKLERLAIELGVKDRVRFLGQIAHADLPDIYSAADMLVLASSREGWANVLLEAMACGTPVIASDVWGTKEVVKESAAGKLISDRTPEAIANAAQSLFDHMPSRTSTRKYAERFSWQETTQGQLHVFASITKTPDSRAK